MKRYYWIIALMITMMIQGCSSKQNHIVKIYTLKYDTSLDKDKTTVFPNMTIKIAMPQSTKEIRTDRILYTKTQYQREAYAYSRWGDTPNHMIEQYLVSFLDETELFKSVIPNNSIAKSQLLLESHIEEFYQYFDKQGHSFAIVKISFILIKQEDKQIISKHTLTTKTPSSSLDAKGGVVAFNDALNQICIKLVSWLKNTI